MAEGHHWVPTSVRKKLETFLSTDAQKTFKRSVTGDPYGVTHDATSQNGVSHNEYNQRVMSKLSEKIDRLRNEGALVKGKLTGPQAEAFVAGIKKNGLGDKRIQLFNQGVLKTLKLIALGGIMMKGLEQAARAQNLGNAVISNNHYKNAVVALQRGDWRRANAEIQGGYPSGKNLVDDLINAGYYRDGLTLLGLWQRREKDFIKIENGQSVAGVPDDF